MNTRDQKAVELIAAEISKSPANMKITDTLTKRQIVANEIASQYARKAYNVRLLNESMEALTLAKEISAAAIGITGK